MVKIGIIGCGKMANAHAFEIMRISDACISAVCDLDEVKRTEFAEKYGAKPYADYTEMTKSVNLDLVMICLPPALHGDCVRHCAQMGINVFIEKPMGIDASDCRSMIDECRKNNVMLWVGHMQKYSVENRIAKELIESGKYGKLVAINEIRSCKYPADTSPKWLMDRKIAGGGMMYNLGAHTLDMAQYLGDSKIRLSECSANFVDGEAENMASGFLKLENDVAVTFNLLGSCKVRRYRIELYLTEGQIFITPWEKVEACGVDGEIKLIKETSQLYADRKEAWQYHQLCDIISAVRNGEKVNSGEYGLGIIECLEKLYKSAGRK